MTQKEYVHALMKMQTSLAIIYSNLQNDPPTRSWEGWIDRDHIEFMKERINVAYSAINEALLGGPGDI